MFVSNTLLLIFLLFGHVCVAQQVWWDRIRTDYNGSAPLKQCRLRRNKAPTPYVRCGRKLKACFFGTQECSSTVGKYPTEKCECSGIIWTCETVSCPVEPPVQAAPAFFSASTPNRAFNVKMNLLTDLVLEGYTEKSELFDDLKQAVLFYLNAFIENQARYLSYYDEIASQTNSPAISPAFGEISFGPPTSVVADASGPSTGGANDFQTNNQEDGVDEADLVKSDGNYVYAGYGDLLVVWNAFTGDLVADYRLPGTSSYIQPSISALSLDSDRLVVYVYGYGPDLRFNADTVFKYDAFDTRILVFDTSQLPAGLNIVAQEDIHGYYRDARAVGSDIYVVTTSNINFYPLEEPLFASLDEFRGMNTTEYKAAAARIATPLVDKFVATLENDISQNGMIPNIPKISIWQTDLGENTNIVENIYSNGAIESFVQLTSFSIKDLHGDLSLNIAGAFTPSSWGYTYAVGGNLVFAARAWNWNNDFGGSTQTTYLLGFKLNGVSATPSFLGSVPGYIDNQYYLSIYEGHLRVAATVLSFWPIFIPPQVDSTLDSISLPQPISTTKNTVYIFKLPTDTNSLTEVSRVSDLGKPNEVFTAVRFLKNICYAVTFQQTDPLYVIQLDPSDVKVLGELEISGFSSYLHSINADDTLLVAVGQEADVFGVVLGLQITLFDATDPAKPVSLQRAVVEQDRDVWSSSNVEWDFKAFRWLSLGDEVGILIIPLRVESYSSENLQGNFDGFMVYDVSRTGISQRLTISHVAPEAFYSCYRRAYLPERSFVFNGNVTTMKGHSVLSTDLDSGETRWKLDMPSPPAAECVFSWIFD